MDKSVLNDNSNKLDIPAPYAIPTEEMYRTEMKEKASFLTKGNLVGKTPSLLRGTTTPMGVEIPLEQGISLNESGGSTVYPYNISTVVVAKTTAAEAYKLGEKPLYYGSGSIRVRVERNNVPNTGESRASRMNRITDVLNRTIAPFTSLFAFLQVYCKALAGKTAESVCKFFGYSPYPRGEKVSAPLYYEATFSDELQPTRTVNEEKLLATLGKIDKPADIPDSCCVFSFPNEWGDVICKVAVVYRHENRTKTLCPMTPFLQHGSHDAEMFRFLASKTIPWSQYDFQDRVVVITDNVEFAFWNRERFLAEGKLLITFPETYGYYNNLDLKALNQAEKVYLLTANFANETIADACIAQLPFAEAIHDELDEKSKFGVIVMSLAFEPFTDDIQTTAKLAEFIRQHKPQVRESYIATSLDDFKTLCGNMAQKIQRKQDAEKALYTIKDEMPEEGKAVAVPEKKATAKTQWLMRSAADKGGHIELIGQEKTGKTNFAVTLAYEIVTANQQKTAGLIPGRFWTVAKTADPKAVYLDAELGKARFNVIRDRVKSAYLPKKAKEAAELDANFIYHDLYEAGIPYAKRENHQHILDLIAAAEHEGTPGPVGMVILDTRRGFTLNQIGLEPQFAELINKIRRRFGPNVFVCHHMDENNKAAGNTSVTTGKTGMITMCRDYVSPEESREKCNLSHPVKFQLSTYGAFQPAFDTEPFYAKCEDGRWTLMEIDGKPNGLNTQFKPVEFDEKAILKELVRDYKKVAKLTMSEIAEYLGITDDTLRERLK